MIRFPPLDCVVISSYTISPVIPYLQLYHSPSSDRYTCNWNAMKSFFKALKSEMPSMLSLHTWGFQGGWRQNYILREVLRWLEENSARYCATLHCTELFIFTFPLSKYDLNNVEKDVKHQFIIIYLLLMSISVSDTYSNLNPYSANHNCSRWQYDSFLVFFWEVQAWHFMWMVCQVL